MIFRVQIGFPADSALPRDVITINPHYFGDSPQALADALKTNLVANVAVGATTPFTVKVYDAVKAPPSYPLASSAQAGTPITSSKPREVALCLSYYSTYNRPSYRGRLYLPSAFITGSLGARPTASQITGVLGWRTTLATGLPASHNMVVYSKKLGQSFGVTNFWVDDEWDTVRSRGMRGTTRQLATLP